MTKDKLIVEEIDARALIAMIDNMLPEVNELSKIAAMHLTMANAVLVQGLIDQKKRKKRRN